MSAAWQLYRSFLNEPDSIDAVHSPAGDKLRENFRRIADELVAVPPVSAAYTKPAVSFDWFGYDVKKTAAGSYGIYHPTTGRPVDVSSLAPAVTGTDYYLGFPGASDANAGTSPAASLQTLNAALLKSDVARVYALGKTYPRNVGLMPASWTPGRNVQIIGVGAPAVFSAHDNLTWTLAAGQTATYQATRSAVAWVWDARGSQLAADGSFKRLVNQTSIANVEANPGSWFASGGIVYVRTFDSRNLATSGPVSGSDTDIRVFLDVPFGNFTTAANTLYLENVGFHGGSQTMVPAASGAGRGTLVAKDSEFSYPYTASAGVGDALTVTGFDVQNVRSVHAKKDGFSYEVSGGGQISRVVEIGCYSVRHGYDNSHINNASTIHSAGSIVRVGGEYAYSEGPVIADVNGSTSLNVGVNSHDCLLLGGADRFNYLIDGTMWLDECRSNALDDWKCYEVYASAGTVKMRNPKFPRANYFTQPNGTGTQTFSYP